MKLFTRNIALIAAFSTAGLLAACGGGGGSTTNQTSGTLQVHLTDAPACGLDAVNVTVAKVRAHQSSTANENDAGWTDITLNPARKINLLNLTNGALEDLGQTPLVAGHYTQLRLVLAANSAAQPLANSVVPTGGVETAISTPSAVQSGIKLINEFDVAANTLVDLTLDFDACKSIVKQGNGNYALKPVISVVPMLVSGSISGVIDPTLASSKPVVTAQLNGVIVKSTVPDAQGAFTLSPLVQSSTSGNYDVVVTADAHASDVIASVPVTAKANTVISTATGPFTLATSATKNISGSVSPASAAATLRAIQSFTRPVTIKYQNADLSTGAYSLALPVAAPSLGQYSGTLPIVLSAQPAVAGKYTVEASASGFLTQQSAADISSADQVQNFTLAP